MAKKTRYIVHLRNEHVARFSHFEDALQYGRMRSKFDGTIEVSAPDGVIGQFQHGLATPEFKHLDK